MLDLGSDSAVETQPKECGGGIIITIRVLYRLGMLIHLLQSFIIQRP